MSRKRKEEREREGGLWGKGRGVGRGSERKRRERKNERKEEREKVPNQSLRNQSILLCYTRADGYSSLPPELSGIKMHKARKVNKYI